MALTVTQCAEWIRLTLGGTPGGITSTLQLVNMAGRALTRMTAWRWLEGAEVDLDVVADQGYVVLPANFSKPISLVQASARGEIEWITREEMVARRQRLAPRTSDTGCVYVAVSTAAGSGSTPPTARLEIDPPRATSATAYFKLVYKAKWIDLSDESDYVQVPDWCEDLYIAILQAYARGFLREEDGTFDLRMAALRGGQTFKDAIREDKSKQTSWGPIRGSIADWSVRTGLILTTTTGPT